MSEEPQYSPVTDAWLGKIERRLSEPDPFRTTPTSRKRPTGDEDNDPRDAKRTRLVMMIQETKDNLYAVRLLALGERAFLFTYPATSGVLQRRAHVGPPVAELGETTRPDGTGRPYAVTTQRVLEPFTYRGETYPPALWAPLVFGKDRERGDRPVDGLGVWAFQPTERPPFPTEGLRVALYDYGVRHDVIVMDLGFSRVDTPDGRGQRLALNALDLAKVARILEDRFGWAPTWDDPGPEIVPWEDRLANYEE
jgi:hypothetical protein